MASDEFKRGVDVAYARAREEIWGAWLAGFQAYQESAIRLVEGLYAASGTPVLPREQLIRKLKEIEPPEDFARDYMRANGL